MASIEFAHDGDGARTGVHPREPSETRLSEFAEALAQRNTELLITEVERIRSEAGDHLAEQCRLLAALSLSVATAEARRERRITELERELREVEQAAPKPLSIPRRREGDPASSSVADLWSERNPGR